MFKKCRENQCLNREMIDFINRQLNLLKQLAKKANELAAEVVSDQLLECVAIMEKRIIFAIEEKPNQQFHDYVSDFYEDKLQKIRKELSNELQRNKRLQNKIQQLSQSLKASEQGLIRNKSYDISSVHQNLSLKNELVHSQRLITQNQQIMQAQNNLINELKVCIVHAEERQSEARRKFEQKIKALDDALNAKNKKTIQLMKQFESEGKRMDKQFRQVQLLNLSLVQQKDALESEVILKSQEIKLLSKKIYDQNMLINKFQRQLQFHEGVLQEEKVGLNRTFDENKLLKQKLREIERQHDKRISFKAKQIKQLQEKIVNLISVNKELQSHNHKNSVTCEKYSTELKQKKEELAKLEAQSTDFQSKTRELQKEIKRLERRNRENSQRLKENQDSTLEKEEEIKQYKEMVNRLKKDLEKCQLSFDREKQLIKKDIEAEFVRLVNLNKQMLSSIEKGQSQSVLLKKQVEDLNQKNAVLSLTIQQLSQSFEQAKKMTNKIEQEKHDLDYIREQLQVKLKHSQRKNEQLSKNYQEQLELAREKDKYQEIQQESLKLIKQKQTQIEKYKRIISEQSTKKLGMESQSIKQMKEELCKKQFMIKQLTSKLNEVQSQLRDINRRYQLEKEAMTLQIRDMERIIQDNFDHSNGSNRLIDSALI